MYLQNLSNPIKKKRMGFISDCLKGFWESENAANTMSFVVTLSDNF